MHDRYDIEEIIYYAQKGMPARFIKEELGLSISERQVQRVVATRLGRRPTRQAIQRPDSLRDRVVAYMESQGLDRYYCTACERRRLEPGFIRALNADRSLDVLVFVCRHCSVASDV
ncbi:hypothetical protein [Rathayibacter festucae]|uniref:Uncharacterized protein n=1 Tax=Rathayibacter festucae DSM 15932 TaxID=1328866 RepID=A0A3Q9UWE2_9MICO|nr:hypothetical protein [Rathayibacter festucae]AZZ51405.1 hypothetical protein C1I64_04680 [Rathayibacter festucae DSM 15932]